MNAPRRVRIEKAVIARIYRSLTGKGKLMVSPGQEVTPEEIIGIGELSAGFTSLSISSLLGVDPKDIKKYLRKNLGQRIYKGELVAYKSASWFSKAKYVACPTDGILDFINEKNGEVKITRLAQKTELPAGVYGIVESLDQNLGQIAIRTQVSRVWGVCGSGRPRDGILEIITKRNDALGKANVMPKHDGSILVNGSLLARESVMMGISNGVSGIITGGISASDYKAIAGGRLVFPKKLENDIGMSVIACEGFGSQPIGEDIYELLSEYDHRFVTIDGNHAFLNLPSYESDSMIKIRKTNLPEEQSQLFGQPELVELKLGQMVRVVGSSYSSEQGKVVAMDSSKTLLPSKISAFLVTVATARRKIQVPVENVEVII